MISQEVPPTLQCHTPVMCKVALDEMSGCQCREQREFPAAGKNGSTGGDPGQLSSILTSGLAPLWRQRWKEVGVKGQWW